MLQLRLPNIPENALNNRTKFAADDPNRPKTEKDLQEENGGAGKYNVDLKSIIIILNILYRILPNG